MMTIRPNCHRNQNPAMTDKKQKRPVRGGRTLKNIAKDLDSEETTNQKPKSPRSLKAIAASVDESAPTRPSKPKGKSPRSLKSIAADMNSASNTVSTTTAKPTKPQRPS